MSDDWRGPPEEEKPIDNWFRYRYKKDSVYVLDIDKLICDPSISHGALIELKHVDAQDKRWRATWKLAKNLNWWAGLVEHDGLEPRYITAFDPSGTRIERRPFDQEKFDAWVCREFGAKIRKAS